MVSDESLQCRAATPVDDGHAGERAALWHTVAFPRGAHTASACFTGVGGAPILVVVHRLGAGREDSDEEARLVYRGRRVVPADHPAILYHAEQLARGLGARWLVTQEKIPAPEPDGLDAFAAAGFEALDESWTFECPFDDLASRIERVHALLVRRERVPPSFHVTGLSAGLACVRAYLDSAGLMDGFDFDARIEGRSAYPILVDQSRLVWEGETIVGLLLATETEANDVFAVPVRWIAAGARQTWVNACLVQVAVEVGRFNNARFIRFNANPATHKETLRLAEQANGRRIACVQRYGKRLADG